MKKIIVEAIKNGKVTVFVSSGDLHVMFGNGGADAVIPTKSIGETYLFRVPAYASYIDTDLSGIEEILEETGIAKPAEPYGKHFVKEYEGSLYPLYQFDRDRLRKLDPEGCRAYEERCLQ